MFTATHNIKKHSRRSFGTSASSTTGFTPTPIMVWLHRVFTKPKRLSQKSTYKNINLNENHRSKNTTPQLVSGFTIIETLVAITILLVAIVGPMTLTSDNLTAARISSERLTATMLAQEAVEYVRYERGNNFLQGSDWMAGVGGPCSGKGCYIDIPQGNISSCGGGCADPLSYNTETHQYGYTTGSPWIASPYIREVQISTAGDEAIVVAVVYWNDGNTMRSTRSRAVLHRWYGSADE